MSKRHTILIADPDKETLRTLKEALAAEYEIVLARDGSKALELSVLKYPDLIIFYRGCPLIGANQFLRILRTNPKTEETPLIIVTDATGPTDSTPASFLSGIWVKPLNPDEVRAQVTSILRKVDAAKQVGGEEGAVSGRLDQISIADLLQIFSINRRSGCVHLSAETEQQVAEVYLHDGRIEDAAVGCVRGLKALFRLIGWRGGRFSFVPGERAAAVSISDSTDGLLMEAARQGDELNRLASEIPEREAVVERIVPIEALPEGLHPVTAEIFRLVEMFPKVADLMDRATCTDMEFFVALKTLIEAGFLRIAARLQDYDHEAIISAEEVLQLRSRLRRAGLVPAYLNTPKVLVLASDQNQLLGAAAIMAGLPGFVSLISTVAPKQYFGLMASLHCDQSMRIDFLALPIGDSWLPLVYALSAGTIAALVLGTGAISNLAKIFECVEVERRVPLLFLRTSQDPELSPNHLRTVMEIKDLDATGLRLGLRVLLTKVAGSDLRGATL